MFIYTPACVYTLYSQLSQLSWGLQESFTLPKRPFLDHRRGVDDIPISERDRGAWRGQQPPTASEADQGPTSPPGLDHRTGLHLLLSRLLPRVQPSTGEVPPQHLLPKCAQVVHSENTRLHLHFYIGTISFVIADIRLPSAWQPNTSVPRNQRL